MPTSEEPLTLPSRKLTSCSHVCASKKQKRGEFNQPIREILYVCVCYVDALGVRSAYKTDLGYESTTYAHSSFWLQFYALSFPGEEKKKKENRFLSSCALTQMGGRFRPTDRFQTHLGVRSLG